jgi:inhibitor of cysteine peptidase
VNAATAAITVRYGRSPPLRGLTGRVEGVCQVAVDNPADGASASRAHRPSGGSRRRRWRWLLVTVAVVLLLVVAAALFGPRVYERFRYGGIYGAERLTVQVGAGDRFSLAVPDRGASVGDRWEVATVPDAAVANLVRNELAVASLHDVIFGPAPGGGGGTRYFTFAARGRGHTTIALHNCFQGCDRPFRQRLSPTITWDVTVR